MVGDKADKEQKNTKLPLIVKGIQSVEDVQLCAEAGVEGVILVRSHRTTFPWPS